MTVDYKTDQETSVTTLVSGILSDAQQLLKQQFELLTNEVRQDFRKAREASGKMSLGVGLGLLATLLLILGAVHLLAWAVPALPLWACYGLCGVVMGVPAIVCYLTGLRQLESLHPLSDQTAQALKENVQWLTHPK